MGWGRDEIQPHPVKQQEFSKSERDIKQSASNFRSKKQWPEINLVGKRTLYLVKWFWDFFFLVIRGRSFLSHSIKFSAIYFHFRIQFDLLKSYQWTWFLLRSNAIVMSWRNLGSRVGDSDKNVASTWHAVSTNLKTKVPCSWLTFGLEVQTYK